MRAHYRALRNRSPVMRRLPTEICRHRTRDGSRAGCRTARRERPELSIQNVDVGQPVAHFVVDVAVIGHIAKAELAAVAEPPTPSLKRRSCRRSTTSTTRPCTSSSLPFRRRSRCSSSCRTATRTATSRIFRFTSRATRVVLFSRVADGNVSAGLIEGSTSQFGALFVGYPKCQAS
jgi:hypothetical protein